MDVYFLCILSKPVYKNMHKLIIHNDNTQTEQYKQKTHISCIEELGFAPLKQFE